MPKDRSVKTPLNHLQRLDAKRKQWTMKNGLRCLHIPLPKGDPRFQITALIGTGSRHEPKDLAGISHLLEHMMFRGSARYPSFKDLSVAFESLGGEWNAATGHEYTEFYYNGTAAKMDETMSLFADFIIRPELRDLETERRIVQRELEGELNENGVSTDPDYHIATKIWPGSPMAMPIIGTPETLANINQEQLKLWYRERYTPDNAVLCVVGGSATKAKQLLNEHFSAWTGSIKSKRGSSVTTQFHGPHSFWVDNSDNEYQVQMSFICEGTGSEKTVVYELLTRILSDGFSSRLTRRIREEMGLVYDISADLHQYDGCGLMNISASVLGENLKPFFKEVFGVLDSLLISDITSDELSRHKDRALTDLDITTSEPSALAWRGSWAILSGTETKLSSWAERFRDIKETRLRTVAGEIFKPENLCVTALGPNDHQIETELPKFIAKWSRRSENS